MIRIAVYGKGGIGKSTTVSNISAVLAKRGMNVMQIGCDPKADSTIRLMGGRRIPAILDIIRNKGNTAQLGEMVRPGSFGVLCVEAGGPTPGTGCAGRGIITAFEMLKQKNAFEIYEPDVILYDVLGDVVCGGFAMPLRRSYSDSVFVITSGENMSIYAAANIAAAVNNFRDRDYAMLSGVILNRRGVEDEDIKVEQFVNDINSNLTGDIDWDPLIQAADSKFMTVLEAFPDSHISKAYEKLADNMLEAYYKTQGDH